MNNEFILSCQNKILAGGNINKDEASKLINIPNYLLHNLSKSANKITREIHGKKIDVEQLTNIKKNKCSEDCSFCSQSAFFDTDVNSYDFLSENEIMRQAKKAFDEGAESYCLVAAWKQPSSNNFTKICDIISKIKQKYPIDIECSLGFLTLEQAKKLKQIGVKRYNHNLETSRTKFPEICTTHTYEDRIKTIKIVKLAGLELCTGGILGLGETRTQRLELILDVAFFVPEEVTINLLVPISGTPLEYQSQLSIDEVLRVFAVTRFLLPNSIIKISGGREFNLFDDGEKLLLSGANGIISSGYLTLEGNDTNKDVKMIKKIGLET
ncbi:MAG: biotin synthase BioB [Thaumarchaeota archaeon]|nr:biotin synthase BioB [Nitrososphaerota archaeon]